LASDNFVVEFPVTVPADSTRSLMFFSALVFDGSDGALSGGPFDDMDEMKEFGLLGGLGAERQAEIVNWKLAP
jgi:hypothetical protein